MSLVEVAVGGCFAGALSSTGIALLMSKQGGTGKSGVKTDPSSPKTSLIQKFMSPQMFMAFSPNTAKTTTKKSGRHVSGDLSVTNRMADFSKVGNVRKDLDSKAYVELLAKLIGVSKDLQNNPRMGVISQESKAAAICIKELETLSTRKGGPLIIEELEYVKGRPNLKITYPGATSKTVSFVGSHLDVVPANPETWSVDPFQLTVKGDKLYGRGTTDCLGHVALLTRLLYELAQARPKLARSVIVLFIAAEEGGESGVGVDAAMKAGKLEDCKNGPVYWVDSADSQPCCGSAGSLSWSLKCTGRLFHSGFPHKGINSIELAKEAMSFVQDRFYEDFPPHPDEDGYKFACGSSMKPTQIDCAKGSFNQICPVTTMYGDIRLSPFYDVMEVVKKVESYVEELNDEMDRLPNKGPWSKFVLGDSVATVEGEARRGKVELTWAGTMESFKTMEGIAVNIDSEGHKTLVQSIRETYAEAKPFSVSGSLPLVRMMQRQGFDLQLCGFGLLSVYHGIDEYCTLSEMEKAYEVFLRILSLLETV